MADPEDFLDTQRGAFFWQVCATGAVIFAGAVYMGLRAGGLL